MAASSTTSPVSLTRVLCTASARQSAFGRARDTADTMTTPMSTVGPNQLRVPVAGARDA